MLMIDISVKKMFEVGVHFGHKTRFWNPKMAPYIFGVRHDIHIIDLRQTALLFKLALNFVSRIAENRGKILFVGTKSEGIGRVIEEQAIRSGMPYVNHRWLGGMLTNYKTIRQSIKRLKSLEAYLKDKDNLVAMTKKEVLHLTREKDKLAANISGIKDMGGLPDALLVIDVNHEKIAVREASRLGIPVIGVVDTNSIPKDIDYMIPGNDDGTRAVEFYCSTVADLILAEKANLDLEKKEDHKKSDSSQAASSQSAEKIKTVVTKKSTDESTDESTVDQVSSSDDVKTDATEETQDNQPEEKLSKKNDVE